VNEIMEILSPVLGEELAKDVVAHRKGLKCPLTPRGAKALLKQYEMTGNAVEAAEEHLNRGWQGFKAEWMQKGKSFRDERNPMPAQSANYGRPEPIKHQEPASAKIDPERRRQIAELARQAVRTMQ
jgi:hypothetical protein